MTPLKLIALDDEDLTVLAAHLQDAVVKVGDIAYLPREKRFAALCNRFDWAAVLAGGRMPTKRRARTALRFERVLSASLLGIDLQAKNQILSLLTITFEPGKSPAGAVMLVFSGGAAIRLEVECIEAELRDLGAAWRAQSRPDHSGAGGNAASRSTTASAGATNENDTGTTTTPSRKRRVPATK